MNLDLKKHRQKLGISQQKMSNLVGVSICSYRNWEYGAPPTPENKKKLEEVLKNADNNFYRKQQDGEEVESTT